MVGTKFAENLKHYLEQYFDGNVVTYDSNGDYALPNVVVGYDDIQSSFGGDNGHYTINGWVRIQHQGYDDRENALANADAQSIASLLCNKQGILSAMNKPESGTDSRPLTGFGLNGLIYRSDEKTKENNSTVIQINFDAYTALKDF